MFLIKVKTPQRDRLTFSRNVSFSKLQKQPDLIFNPNILQKISLKGYITPLK
jgi:hypothetical protein